MSWHGSTYEDDANLRPRPSRLNSTALSAVAALAFVGAAGGLYAAGLFNALPKLDKATGCRRDIAINHATLVVEDVTDPLTEVHIKRLREQLSTIAKSMPDYGLLQLVVINPDDAAAPRQIFRRCAPRSPERTSAWEAGGEILRRDWQRNFEGPLLATVSDLAASSVHSTRSPIIATLATVTQWPDFDSSVPERRLVVASDLLEHDASYSQLRGDLSVEFRRSRLTKAPWPDLRGVPVMVEYFQRAEPTYARVQTPAHRAFWSWWFKSAGASKVDFFGVREPPVLAPADLGAGERPPQIQRHRRLVEER